MRRLLVQLAGCGAPFIPKRATEGKRCGCILYPHYRWEYWAAPMAPDRQIDHNRAMAGDAPRDFAKLQELFADSPKSWSVGAGTIDKTTSNLSMKNPNGGEAVVHRSPQDILAEIAALDAESVAVIATIWELS